MASPWCSRARTYRLHAIPVSITVAFIFFLSVLLLPTKSDLPGASLLINSTERDREESNKKVIGSKPPSCVNKCMKCKPCLATLVVPDHQRNKGFRVGSRGEDDTDTYYLLSWKCTCGDKLFQP